MGFLDPISGREFDAAKARHLLQRAGFGVPFPKVAEMVRVGLERCVDALVNYEQFPDEHVEPDFLVPEVAPAERRARMEGLSDEERRKANNEYQRAQRQAVDKLKGHWLGEMRRTNRPLQEKLTLFWHGHFAVAQEKVKNSAAIYDYYRALRNNASGSFKDLVFEVGKTPAMLVYLDNRQNRKGKPNENWARELMELFTLGIGHYSEEDIREAARAFSGYTVANQKFAFVKRQHDYGEKKFLGRTGKFDGKDIIDIIFEQPQAARFIARKLWEFFAYENPPEELVEELAALLRSGNFELKPFLATVFQSREFFGPRAVATQVKSPAQYLVQLLADLEVSLPRDQMALLALRGLGQDLLNPPNVKGWEGNRAWINTNTLLLRYNIPAYIVTGERFDRAAPARLDEGEEGGSMMQMEGATPPGRPARGAAAGRRAGRRARPLIDAKKLFSEHEGKTAAQAAQAMAARLLCRPLDAQQLGIIAGALTKSGDPAEALSKATTTEQHLLAGLHLLLSTAEYQLC